MSKSGIKLAANVFESLQLTRGALLRIGSKQPSTKSGKQDILLAQMLEKAKEHVKDDFIKIMNFEGC